MAQSAQTLWFAPGSVPSQAASAGRVKGLRFGGFLTAEDAELFQILIDAAAKPRKTPSGELDPRTLGQRRADALSTVLRAAASTGGEIPAHGGIEPHLSVTIPYTTLTTLMADSPLTIASSRTLAAAEQTLRLPGAPTAGLALNARAPMAPDLRTDLTRLGNTASSAGVLVFGDPLGAGEVRRMACDAAAWSPQPSAGP